jgi:tRNA-modifying protein YgfZ
MLDFTLPASRLKSLRTGNLVVPEAAAIFRVEGPGALTCLQGLLTSDLAAPGDASLSYGALLTPKGMIVVDPWVIRETERFTLVLDSAGHEAAAQLLKRVLPPRLARVSDLTGEWSAVVLLGTCAVDRFARANGCPVPAAGQVVSLPDGLALLAAGAPQAPFSALLVGPSSELTRRLEHATVERGGASAVAAARVLAGWPSLGREIDERTLPQEVRFDELGAVSYVKGCYTGQETVARVHFRGHVNRTLRGVRLPGGEPLAERTLRLAGKEAGTLRTALLLEDRVIGLAIVRREIENGTTLLAGEREATLVGLPFDSA